jgi:nicotinamide-nucleotide amidase
MDNDIYSGLTTLAAELGRLLASRGLTLATAESCTGGLIGHALTEVPGSSDWFQGGVIAYSNQAKEHLLHVPVSAIHDHGAVSESVVRFMALGARNELHADLGVAVSGIAGPTGGTPEKPVGTVWIGWDMNGEQDAEVFLFGGTRSQVKLHTARAAIQGLLQRMG